MHHTIAMCLGVLVATSAWAEVPAEVETETPDAEAPSGGEASSDEAPSSEPPPPIEVSLQAAGEGPRKPLRIRLPKNDTYELQIQRASTHEVRIDDADPVSTVAPTAVHELRATVDDAHTQLAVTGADLLGAELQVLAMLNTLVGRIEDLRFGVPHDAHLRQHTVIAGVPEDVDEITGELIGDVAWALQAVTVPLPEEPVGIGATWTWTRDAEEQGVPVRQAFEATLTERSRRRIVVDVTFTAQTAAPEAGEALVDAMDARGSGTVWIDTARALPRGATLTLEGTLASAWNDPEKGDRRLDATFKAEVTLATR